MPLSREDIIQKELDYFKSDLAAEPAFITDFEDDEFDGPQGGCVYKTKDGRKCAVGALIKPTLYDSKIDDGGGVSAIGLPEHIREYLGKDNITWLNSLQECHDNLAKNWEDERLFEERNHFGRHFLARAKEQGLLS